MANNQSIVRSQGGAPIVPVGEHRTDVLASFATQRALINDVMEKSPIVRDHTAVLNRIRTLAQAAGDDFFYSWKAAGQIIEGPSIKAAQALLRAIGHAYIFPSHVTEPDAWVFTIYLFDRESGTLHSRQYRQRRNQATFSAEKMKDQETAQRAEDIAFSIGQSKAWRNVVVRAFEPEAEFAVREAKLCITEKVEKNPEQYKVAIAGRLAKLAVPVERVSKWIGHGPEKWTPADIVRVGAALNAIGEGVLDAHQVWPDPVVASGPPSPPPAPPANNEPPPAEPQGRPGPDDDMLPM